MAHSEDSDTTAKDESIALIDEAMGSLISRIRANWKDTAAAVHPELQPVGYSILATLVRHGNMPFGDVAEALAMDKSVLSRQVRMLEAWALVECKPDPADGRARILSPTALATESLGTVRSKVHTRYYDRLRTWDDDDLTNFAGYLQRLSALSEK